MRFFTLKTTLLTATLCAGLAAPAFADTTSSQGPVVATVDNAPIYKSEVDKAISALPPQLQKMPVEQLRHILTDQMVKQKLLMDAAEKAGTAKDPEVQAQIKKVTDNIITNAYLSKIIMPKLTDQAINDYYQKNYANKPAETEVHARHILVPTEAQAKDIIAQLKKGADFGKLAQKYSTDKASAKQNGGDLGWFKKENMVPAFANAAFSMNPKTYSQTPVKTDFGYHIIQILEKRTAPVPKLDAVKAEIRQKLIQQNLQQVMNEAVKTSKIVYFDDNGKPITPPSPDQAPAAAPSK